MWFRDRWPAPNAGIFHDMLRFDGTAWRVRGDAAKAIGRYIDGFYNPIRRHSALDFTSPARFEKIAAT